MSILVLGLNHKTAPVGLLERVAVPPDRLGKALTSLINREHLLGAVVLSTCNRVEVYAHVGRYHGGVADVRNFLCEWGGLAPEDLVDHTYDYFDNRAAAHLFAVTTGLDSMVVGERQIHLQVKAAFTQAEAEGTSDRLLATLFRQALRVGKRARAETGISRGASSMVDVGLEAAGRVLGSLEDRTVFVVGAGMMGGLAAGRVRGACGRIVVTNRTADKARRLADRVGGEVVDFAALGQGLAAADLVLASTSSAHPVIGVDRVAAAMRARPDRPLVLVDLAVPRDVDPGCWAVPGVTVLDVDAVRELTATGPAAQPADGGARGGGAARDRGLAGEVDRARALVEEEAARYSSWIRSVRVEPTIAALRAHAERVRAAEVERLGGRLGDLDDRQRAALDALTKGIVNTLLHDPSVRLKAVAEARGGDPYASALRELFDLPE